ncbi:MAG TPA: type II toxin-antitoxin system RelE/ParE family toxin [Candidatus Binatia bacterium]|nr:type II toxin-antitoxin system RelE/ParE family toxin [Candidatus Binatia bacterium]
MIRGLASDPRPPGCRKLSGYDDVFRVRVGRYRVLYAVEDRRLLVLVLKVGDRKDASGERVASRRRHAARRSTTTGIPSDGASVTLRRTTRT